MNRKKILIIEDEKGILELLKFNLTKEGYNVETVISGKDAINAINIKMPDLIILDLMLPDIDGFDLCRLLKSSDNTRNIPIIMLTAKDDETDIITGLALGAEDYITKPFSIKILMARIKTVLRRKNENIMPNNHIIRNQDLEINPEKHEVIIKNKLIDLTYSEFRTLYLLASNPGRVFTRNQIIETVRGDDCEALDRSVDALMVSLRKKLGPDNHQIETVWGVGYRFKE